MNAAPNTSSPSPEALIADRYLDDCRAEDVVRIAIRDMFPGHIALVSSFGAESAVLLHIAASVDPAVPVLFVDTGKLFGETKAYRDALVARLGLADVRTVRADPATLAASDPDGVLWRSDPERCCAIRKVDPLRDALKPFAAWINGRKRHHGAARDSLDVVEIDGPRVKFNPLAAWSAADIAAYMARHGLPAHPLVADGFASIGCMPCTTRVAPGEDVRAGRWRGTAKTECGIHLPPPGRSD